MYLKIQNIFFALVLTLASGTLVDACLTPQSGAKSDAMETKDSAAPQTQDTEMSAEAKAFLNLQNVIKKNKARIDQLYRTLPIGFPKRRDKFKEEIDNLTKANVELEKQVFSKAKAAFASSEKPSQQSVTILQNRLISTLRPAGLDDRFDPESSLELIFMLKEKFPENKSLLEYEFLANYALERFEESKAALIKLEEATKSSAAQTLSLSRRIVDAKTELAETIDKYQQELLIRRLESNTDDLPRVLIETTEGNILVELFENHAPNTVANFIHLARDQKFYDGKLFHLVKPGEYAQTGSPNGDGMGDAGYRIPCECYQDNIRSHFRGTLSMISPTKDRGGSQFFITQQPNPRSFDGKYTAFGRVLEGMDVVMKLKNVDLSGRLSSAANVSKINRVVVQRTRSHPYVPTKLKSGFARPDANIGSASKGSGSRNQDPPASEATDTPGSFALLIQGNGGK